MSNVKKISLIAVVMILVLAISSVFAAEKEYVTVKTTVTYNGKTLTNGDVLKGVKAGEKITVTASCSDARAISWSTNTNYLKDKGYTYNKEGMAFIGYLFDSTDSSKYIDDLKNPASITITIPNFKAGSEHFLVVNAVAACDGLMDNGKEIQATSGTLAYKFTMDDGSTPVEDGYVEVKYNGNRLTDGGVPIHVDSNSIKVTLSGVPSSKFSSIVYTTNNGRSEEVANPKGQTITIDLEPGVQKTLQVYGLYKDNSQTPVSKYNFIWDYVPENDDLIVEDYMKENKDLDTLAVSLRNDSDDYDKHNKNVYALDEEVVYYVDYKNGGNDIKKEVKLVLELPLEFEAVSTYGGTVDHDKKTITWTMDGLEKDAAGTKIVKVRYIKLSRNSKKAEVVYPVAKIYLVNKEKDASAVINYIFKDDDTEIGDEHYPYMFGDKNKTTFRPDDGISRAEGALVLARIFGINYTGTTVRGDEFADLEDTYIEAQRAIVACSKIGIISGYTDGTYRPNNKMTRAEFMKIIASYVEVNAEDDDIKGLEVKTDDNAIKLYKNPTNVYMTGSTTTSSHWAINYVTLLCRLNMTSVSDSNKNLRLDEEITRAEVAQLVNFYLLRAPAESGKTEFSDVAKNHKLFRDILEATRPAHTYYLTSDGTEIAEFDK